ncbi:hypothetical protein PR048_009845 [Dryococelus australis]|uniref:Uncharacterized protein n=1 Tax=Dryococelus australis TaxID=614101 RepID=A0ABQ9I142_9NEOP|nr:hypothetical protein PR048_009845 [Dryococelus australis]
MKEVGWSSLKDRRKVEPLVRMYRLVNEEGGWGGLHCKLSKGVFRGRGNNIHACEVCEGVECVEGGIGIRERGWLNPGREWKRSLLGEGEVRELATGRIKATLDHKKVVIDLSDKQLDEATITILSKGMNFAVTPTTLPIEDLVYVVESSILHLPVTLANEIRAETSRILRKAKLPLPNEKRALKDLCSDTEIKILRVDKGNAAVVVNNCDYNTTISNLLSDAVYSSANRNPLGKIDTSAEKLVKDSSIEEKKKKQLIVKDSRTPAFYDLPKIHKPDVLLQSIVSAVGSHSSADQIPQQNPATSLTLSGLTHTKLPTCIGPVVAERLACLSPNELNQVQSLVGSRPGFRMCELCWTMLLVAGLHVDLPLPSFSFRRYFILTSITVISSQDLAVAICPNLLIHSLT